MEPFSHSIESLFSQLGLANSQQAIEKFCKEHHLDSDVALEQADFWTAGQAQFIREALEQDSDWCEVVDQLDAQLRH